MRSGVHKSLMVLVFLALPSIGGCDTPETCTSWSGGAGPDLSQAAFSACKDGRTREVVCKGKPLKCSCVSGGTISKTYERAQPFPQIYSEAETEANVACGWKLRH